MRKSKSAEDNLAKPANFLDYGQPTEPCCGAACNTAKRDNELKLIGAREYNRLLQKTVVLTDAQIHCLNTVESEYHLSLV